MYVSSTIRMGAADITARDEWQGWYGERSKSVKGRRRHAMIDGRRSAASRICCDAQLAHGVTKARAMTSLEAPHALR